MVAIVENRRNEIEQICRRYGVQRLELFGSAARSNAHPNDLDFLVEFHSPHIDGFSDRFFGLLSDLESLFKMPIDLLTSESVRDPHLRAGIERSRQLVYEQSNQASE